MSANSNATEAPAKTMDGTKLTTAHANLTKAFEAFGNEVRASMDTAVKGKHWNSLKSLAAIESSLEKTGERIAGAGERIETAVKKSGPKAKKEKKEKAKK